MRKASSVLSVSDVFQQVETLLTVCIQTLFALIFADVFCHFGSPVLAHGQALPALYFADSSRELESGVLVSV